MLSDKQFLNPYLLVSITQFGIVTFSSNEHSENTKSSIFLTPFGISIFSSDEHPENAYE